MPPGIPKLREVFGAVDAGCLGILGDRLQPAARCHRHQLAQPDCRDNVGRVAAGDRSQHLLVLAEDRRHVNEDLIRVLGVEFVDQLLQFVKFKAAPACPVVEEGLAAFCSRLASRRRCDRDGAGRQGHGGTAHANHL
ncbi:MAG: hypothetical protein NTV69_09920 [Caldilinea sp.]|nr:hypothetical protein [Caldilinea sp.]